MASSWGGVSFHILADEQGGVPTHPVLVADDYGTVRTKVPYANIEHVQFTGRTNSRLHVKCLIENDNDFASLLAMVCNGLPGTLTVEWGGTISNLLLTEIKDVWRVTFVAETYFTLGFDQVFIG